MFILSVEEKSSDEFLSVVIGVLYVVSSHLAFSLEAGSYPSSLSSLRAAIHQALGDELQ